MEDDIIMQTDKGIYRFLDNIDLVVSEAKSVSHDKEQFLYFCSKKLIITDPQTFLNTYWHNPLGYRTKNKVIQ